MWNSICKLVFQWSQHERVRILRTHGSKSWYRGKFQMRSVPMQNKPKYKIYVKSAQSSFCKVGRNLNSNIYISAKVDSPKIGLRDVEWFTNSIVVFGDSMRVNHFMIKKCIFVSFWVWSILPWSILYPLYIGYTRNKVWNRWMD